MTREWILKATAVFLLTADIGLAVFWQPVDPPHLRTLPAPSAASQPLAPAPTGGDFTFDTAHGTFRLSEQRGKVVLLYFGYTFCPDICPTSLLATAAALNTLTPQELADVRTVFVSVDPDRDTVTQLAGYVRFFHPSIVGATGQRQQIDDAVRSYGASYAIQKPADGKHYVVDHSAQTYLIDRAGRLAETLPHGATPEQFATSIRRILLSPTQGVAK